MCKWTHEACNERYKYMSEWKNDEGWWGGICIPPWEDMWVLRTWMYSRNGWEDLE